MSPLTLVQEAVKKAVPEIMELDFGCKFIWKETPRDYEEEGYVATFENWKEKGISIRCLMHLGQQGIVTKDHITEILGREIRLSDILRTIGPDRILKYPEGGASSSGNIVVSVEGNFMNENGLVLANWNLAEDSLDWHATHRPEVIDFLAGLLE